MKIEIEGLADVVNGLEGLSSYQIPFASALALTKTAQAAQAAVKVEMSRVFDRPTPFTLNSTYVKPATKAHLEAQVYLKDLDNKAGGDARTRLAPQVYGGGRGFKRMEGALLKHGLMAPGEVAVPGGGAKLDAYGNMSRGQIVQILKYFEAAGDGNMTSVTRAKLARGTKKRMGVRYYLKRDRPGRGIYMATDTAFGSAIQPVLMFVRRAQYRVRLAMPDIVARVTAEQFRGWFASAADEARRTAR